MRSVFVFAGGLLVALSNTTAMACEDSAQKTVIDYMRADRFGDYKIARSMIYPDVRAFYRKPSNDATLLLARLTKLLAASEVGSSIKLDVSSASLDGTHCIVTVRVNQPFSDVATEVTIAAVANDIISGAASRVPIETNEYEMVVEAAPPHWIWHFGAAYNALNSLSGQDFGSLGPAGDPDVPALKALCSTSPKAMAELCATMIFEAAARQEATAGVHFSDVVIETRYRDRYDETVVEIRGRVTNQSSFAIRRLAAQVVLRDAVGDTLSEKEAPLFYPASGTSVGSVSLSPGSSAKFRTLVELDGKFEGPISADLSAADVTPEAPDG